MDAAHLCRQASGWLVTRRFLPSYSTEGQGHMLQESYNSRQPEAFPSLL